MPTFQFEAMDATGQEIKDVIDAPTEEEAQQTIRQMGYFVTRIAQKKQKGPGATVGGKKKRPMAFGGVSGKRQRQSADAAADDDQLHYQLRINASGDIAYSHGAVEPPKYPAGCNIACASKDVH